MKRLLLSLVLTVSTMFSTVWAYDFSVVVPSGQTLYFSISLNDSNNVSVTCPGTAGTHSCYDGYTKPAGNLVIPSSVSYNGTTYSVTAIGSTAFYRCNLTSVTIPNSVTSIGYYAFYQSNLESIEIPNSVTYIRDYAFYDCNGLDSINIPNSVTSIGEYAFYDCGDLTSATIGKHVNSIGVRAFANCYSLRTLNYNAINCSYYFNYGDNLDNYYNDYSILFRSSHISTINIGDSVQRIPELFALGLESLKILTIGNNVTSIGEYAFSGCSSLVPVIIPNSVTSIGECAFSGVEQIFYNGTATSRLCPFNVNSYVVDGNFLYFDSTKTNLALYIGTDTNVTIPNSVSSIGKYAFAYCTALTSINIPNSVTSIGSFAFEGCTGLTSVTIPNSVTSIGSSAFQNCSSLTSVTIPNSVTYIGYSAFQNCSSLTSVTIPNSVTYIGYSAFERCSGLTSVTIGNSVTSIGNEAFADCYRLRTLNYNAINCRDFSNSSERVHDNYEDVWYTIYTGVFPKSLKRINIGDSVQRIPANFAYAIDSLMAIIIPNNVTSIGDFAFNGCSNLRDVTSLATTSPSLGSDIFSAAGILKVPCGSLNSYRYSSWLDYFTIMEEVCDNITITVSSANENMGTVSGGGEYEFGAQVTITATPNQGYRFVRWTDGNTNNPRTITATANATYIATFEEGVGIENIDILDNLTFYPNPTKGILNFSMEVEKIEVMDMMGKMVMQFCNVNEINIASLPKGVYCLRLSYNGKIIVHKIIKE